ncbi:glycoside hydrolase family protein [Leptolyngbya sp. 'hensonii']|uniref:glycoside hydrolase family 24 protein n=1 Tax=Leptolyngbya sp. 'hensonii' TaxID=1922337 RepID=UPI0009F906C6|nr:glycoside hydrolase family protein [Leptolyngbya sp. 'hensonii']
MKAVKESSRPKPRLDSLSIGIVLFTLFLLVKGAGLIFSSKQFDPLPPLVMVGGDPYVRALMRTISASEANGSDPYALLYGGSHVESLKQHPDRCVTIVRGPNMGRCTTAAGRYQFLTSTWLEKARRYHPLARSGNLSAYSFEPEYQDRVVYAWLTDGRAWDADIPTLLREGHLDQVLELLSPTWTSLGHGIESNVMTPHLQEIYQQVLTEERAKVDLLH